MNSLSHFAVFVVACSLSCSSFGLAAEEGEEPEDSSTGLPEDYAKNYLIARSTISPDKRFAVIYPTLDFSDSTDAKDYIVALEPFKVLQALPTEWPYFQSQSHGGMSAEWADDSSTALVTLAGKWGPRDVFLVEFHENELSRVTNLLSEAHDLLLPDYKKAKAARYNEDIAFIFEEGDEPLCHLEGGRQVRFDGHATNHPKGVLRRKWSARLTATWDIAQAKFTEKGISH